MSKQTGYKNQDEVHRELRPDFLRKTDYQCIRIFVE